MPSVAVVTDGSSKSTDVTVRDAAEFDVSSVSADTDPVEPGNTTTVSASVENTGDVSIRQTVSLKDPDGSIADSTSEHLSGSSSTTVHLDWEPSSSDTGDDQTLTVETDDESGTVDVDVLAPADFDVSIDSVTDDPDPGDQVDVNVTIDNGGSAGSETVELLVDGSVEHSIDPHIGTNGSEQRTLEWDTNSDNYGEFGLDVAPSDSDESRDIGVWGEPDGTIVSFDTEETYYDSDTVKFDYEITVRNDGEGPYDHYVKSYAGREGLCLGLEEHHFTLDPGEERTVTGSASSDMTDDDDTYGFGVRYSESHDYVDEWETDIDIGITELMWDDDSDWTLHYGPVGADWDLEFSSDTEYEYIEYTRGSGPSDDSEDSWVTTGQ